MDVLPLPIKQTLETQSLSTVIYVSVLDLSPSELYTCFPAHGIFGFKIDICVCKYMKSTKSQLRIRTIATVSHNTDQ